MFSKACLYVCFRILDCNIYSDDVSIFIHTPKIHVHFLHAVKDYSVQNPSPPSELKIAGDSYQKLNDFKPITSK